VPSHTNTYTYPNTYYYRYADTNTCTYINTCAKSINSTNEYKSSTTANLQWWKWQSIIKST
jgi:hypothetical protein